MYLIHFIHIAFLQSFKKSLENNAWFRNKELVRQLEAPLMRLCARYLYLEKRRGYALNPVGELVFTFTLMETVEITYMSYINTYIH